MMRKATKILENFLEKISYRRFQFSYEFKKPKARWFGVLMKATQ